MPDAKLDCALELTDEIADAYRYVKTGGTVGIVIDLFAKSGS